MAAPGAGVNTSCHIRICYSYIDHTKMHPYSKLFTCTYAYIYASSLYTTLQHQSNCRASARSKGKIGAKETRARIDKGEENSVRPKSCFKVLPHSHEIDGLGSQNNNTNQQTALNQCPLTVPRGSAKKSVMSENRRSS